MDLNINKKNLLIRQNNLNDPEERARILRKYAGIFPNNIKEFGETVIPRMKACKNFSR